MILIIRIRITTIKENNYSNVDSNNSAPKKACSKSSFSRKCYGSSFLSICLAFYITL